MDYNYIQLYITIYYIYEDAVIDNSNHESRWFFCRITLVDPSHTS